MKPEKMRVAIAEACGWTFTDRMETLSGIESCCGHFLKNGDSKWYFEDDLPHYSTKLDAMHEAEQVLTNEQRRAYTANLVSVHPLHYNPIDPANDDKWMSIYFLVNSTAAQRAEAFCRTIPCKCGCQRKTIWDCPRWA